MKKHFRTCLFSVIIISGSASVTTTTTTAAAALAAAARKNHHHHHHHHRTTIRKTQYRPLAQRQGQHPFQVEFDLQQTGGYTHIIGSDDSGAGCIAGPIVTVSLCCCCCCCCHRTTTARSGPDNNNNQSSFTIIPGVMDSKLLTSAQRQDIYQQVMQAPPEHYCWAYAVRSNHEIDERVAAAATATTTTTTTNTNTNSASTCSASSVNKVTQECFAESIQAVVSKLQQQHQRNDTTTTTTTSAQPYSFYSIVDGKHSPAQLSASSSPPPFPSRPWKQADTVVYTVALASILARVIRDNIMSEQLTAAAAANNDDKDNNTRCTTTTTDYAQRYHFDQHGGYPTPQHIAALHQYGPCPLLHRTSSQPVQKWLDMQQYTTTGRRRRLDDDMKKLCQ